MSFSIYIHTYTNQHTRIKPTKHQSLSCNTVTTQIYLIFFPLQISFTTSFSSSSSSSSMASPSEPANSTPGLGIIVESNPSNSRLSELGIKSWPKWGCPPGKYTLKFDAEETCYLVKGKVKAYPKGSNECVEFGAGDVVIIPEGLSCTWDVSVSVDKYYKFESSSSTS